MPRSLTANQTQKVDRPFSQPIYLVHLLLSGLTLYFSDRDYAYNSQNYESYLSDLSNIGNEIRNLGGYNNAQITLQFRNQRIKDKNYLIELFDDYPLEKKYVEIYKLLINTDEVFGSDVSTKIWKGEMGQPYEITELGFKIDCSSMLFGKNASLPLDVIDLADFPSADPDDVGKHRNIIYGSLKKAICPWTVAGYASTIATDINSSVTSVEVSDATGAPATPFVMWIDNEKVNVTNKSGTTFTVTRAYETTIAVAHNKGAVCYEKRADFEAEVAQHPVKSIGDVYVKRPGIREWLRVTSGVTKYINTGGRAYLIFSDKIKLEEKTNQAVSEGTHPHTATFAGVSTKKCIPTGATGGTDPLNAIDGNDASSSPQSASTLRATFTEGNLGTILKEYIHVRVTGPANVFCPVGVAIGTTPGEEGWYRYTKSAYMAWNDLVDITFAVSGQVWEVYKEVEYIPTAPAVLTHAADGVLLSGNSVANMVIGEQVACDVEGYKDDGSGTYTGTPDALIERPDHVRKHILIALLGFVAGDIGSTFATVGTTYASQIGGGYKFAFVLPEVATETMDLFEQFDLQTRSNMFESGGQFHLAFGSTGDPASQMTFDADNTKGNIVFSKTEVADIRNKIRGHYFRDYTQEGKPGDKFQKVNETSNGDSITKYSEMQEDIEFSCIGDLSDMVNDVLDWIILQTKELKKVVNFEAFWDAMILEHCDYFTVNANFWSGLKYRTIRMVEKPETQRIELMGEQYVAV